MLENNDYTVGVTHIDFQRGESGEGNVVIELSDDQVEVDVRFEGQKIRIELSDASVSEFSCSAIMM